MAGAGILSSCNDFLTIYPTNAIVEEDFWKDKTDLNNALMGCYKQIVSNDMLTKYIQWGEMRSDNFERSSVGDVNDDNGNIMNANLLPTYGQFDWTPAYKAINFCNKVIVHGPEVVEKDEAFSINDWKPIRAEAITLRAFCHFLLVRTFGEIPYVTQDYNNDSQELRIPQSTQLAVLDSIIMDLESVVDDAMSDYGNNVDNHGRITKKAIYSLLADVYLWRASYKTGENQPFSKITFASNYAGELTDRSAQRTETYSTTAESDYQKCVEYCDKVIDIVTSEKEKYLNKSGLNIGGAAIEILPEDLIMQNAESTSRKNNIASSYTTSGAYYQLFGVGNCDESIFELQVEGTSYSNTMITSLFWDIRNGRAGTLTGAVPILEAVEESPNVIAPVQLFTKTDYRRWEDLRYVGSGQTSYDINKYINRLVSASTSAGSLVLTDNTTISTYSYSPRTNSSLDANWIVYRMSEIFLMKAEAMTQLSADEENLKSSFNYVREVFKRSNPYAYMPNNSTANKDSLKFESFSEQTSMERLILTERQREFFAEGKRWFDLVRFALRRGSTTEMLDILTRKYANNSKAIRAKLATMQSLYSPVYNNDIKNNNLLYQNSVWAINENSSQTDKLK